MHVQISFSAVNVSFGMSSFFVVEGNGFVKLLLTKTAGAEGPVSVRLFTLDGSATGT